MPLVLLGFPGFLAQTAAENYHETVTEALDASDRYSRVVDSSTPLCTSTHRHSHCTALSMAKQWSARVMRTSNALDLERGVFKKPSARAIARSLKRSAEHSRRRKSGPFRSAMSMLNFHINRGGRGLSRTQRLRLEQAKDELRKLYGRRPSHARKTHPRTRTAKSARR
jgi:hypothetical protein